MADLNSAIRTTVIAAVILWYRLVGRPYTALTTNVKNLNGTHNPLPGVSL